MRRVDARLRLADDAVVFGILERDGVEDRARQSGGFGGEFSVGSFFAGGFVQDTAGFCGAFGSRDRPR